MNTSVQGLCLLPGWQRTCGNHSLWHLTTATGNILIRFDLLQTRGCGWGFSLRTDLSTSTSLLHCHGSAQQYYTGSLLFRSEGKEEYNSAHTCCFSFSSMCSSKTINQNHLPGKWNLLGSRRCWSPVAHNGLERSSMV